MIACDLFSRYRKISVGLFIPPGYADQSEGIKSAEPEMSLSGVVRGFGRFETGALLGGSYIGIFEMGLAYLLWMRALTLAETTAEVGNLVFLTPFIALVLVGLVVGEGIGGPTVAGLVLVIAGNVLQMRLRQGRQKRS